MSEARRFAKLLADFERRLNRLESARSTQLNHSSLEDGSLPSYDSGGNLRQRIGKQIDGTFSVTYANGPQPPKPSTPTAAGKELSLVIYWDGQCLDDADNPIDPPGDFQRVDVHVSEVDGFEPSSATLSGSLVAESVISIAADSNPKFVKLLTVSTSDVASAPSEQVSAQSTGASHLSTVVLDAARIFVPTRNQNEWHLEIGDPEKPIHWLKGTRSGFYVEHDPVADRANTFVSGSVQFGDSVLEEDHIDLDRLDATGFETPGVRQSTNEAGTGLWDHITDNWAQPTSLGNLLVAAVFARDFSTTEQRVNLCTNPKLDNNADGWTAIRAFDSARVGVSNLGDDVDYAFYAYNDATRHAAVGVYGGEVSEGQTYTVQVRVYCDGTTQIRPTIDWYGGGSWLGASRGDPVTIQAGTYRDLTLQATALPSADTAWPYMIMVDASYNGSMWVSRVLMEQTTEERPYFDGDTPDASWSGTAGNSTSTLPPRPPQTPTITPPSGWSEITTSSNTDARLSLFAIPASESRSGMERFEISPESWRAMSMAEIKGIDTVTPLDQTATASGTSTTATTGTTATTTQAEELWLALHAWNLDAASALTPPASDPFMDIQEVFAWTHGKSAYRGVLELAAHNATTTGTVEATRDLGGSSHDWLGIAATFKARPTIGDPTAPSPGMARFYVRDDHRGIAQLHAIDSNGTVAQISGGDPDWTNITLINGWAAQGTPAPSFRMMSDRTVILRGAVGGGVVDTSCGQLPPAYRPPFSMWLPVACSFAGSRTQSTCRLEINANGHITVSDQDSSWPARIDLFNIRFSIV